MNSTAERNEAMFAALISGYATQAMVGLGKIASPITGEIERDLEQARAMIDILEMLEAKTEGNRTEAETGALRQALSMLRLNFVEEVNRPPDADTETGNGEDTAVEGDADVSADDGGSDDDDPSAEHSPKEA